MLRELFEKFDRVCVENKVYKLYTIGDCYVVMGFTNAAKRNEDTILSECLNVVKFGEDMIEKIKETRDVLQLSDAFNMRIGIHFGSIIGGIIGTDIVRYDIYGDDVLIANKMESSGTKGKI